MKRKKCKWSKKEGSYCGHFARFPEENPKYCRTHYIMAMERKEMGGKI
ncbi:MAG: hypothetical protein U9O94_08390 [Nanoarchaeota archaeon]|nr:hypothetical protein [Nanoarchaeota archaeon]